MLFNKRILYTVFIVITLLGLQKMSAQYPNDSEVLGGYADKFELVDFDHPFETDSLLMDSIVIRKPEYALFKYGGEMQDSLMLKSKDELFAFADSVIALPESRKDDIIYGANTLLIPLVFQGKQLDEIWDGKYHFQDLLHGSRFEIDKRIKLKEQNTYDFVTELRRDARSYITQHDASLYVTSYDRLPSLSSFMLSGQTIEGSDVKTLSIYEDKINIARTKIDVESIRQKYWTKRVDALLQFSQNHVSANWHQGGNSNMSFLSVMQGELKYDNRKNVAWENKLEWRTGYNRIKNENALRDLNINDDLLRYYTKFGLKAGGNWYYSVNGEATTQLFNNYKSSTSDELKARLLTPVRVNIGAGMDYKYKKLSMMIAPLSFKYIYLNDTVNIDPNQFGIEKGENQLKQFIGSSVRAELKIKPARNWNLDSRLNFYTDYKKVEVDLEVVNNFVINRFLTTRLIINSRYDNTVILKEGEKARIQYKEFLTIGFAYRLI